MRKGFRLLVSGSVFVTLLLGCPARAQTGKGLLNQADSLFEAAAYDSAAVLASLTLQEARRELGENDTTVARVLHFLSRCNYKQANYAEAESLCNRALAIRTELLGPDHPDVATSLGTLGVIYHTRGELAEAGTLYRRALKITEAAFGPDHPDRAKDLNRLGNVCLNQAKYPEADSLHKRALVISERAFGLDHPEVAVSLTHIANLHFCQGKWAEAEPVYKRALDIWEKALGPDHPRVALCLENLASLYYSQFRYAKAERFYTRALNALEKVFAPDHPRLGTTLNHLALVYSEQGKYAEAEALYRRVLAIREKAFGPAHLKSAEITSHLAILFSYQRKCAEAESLFRAALVVVKKGLGPNHPDVAWNLNHLANACRDQGNYEQAESFYRQALTITEMSLGIDHRQATDLLHDMALLFWEKRDFANATKRGQRAYILRRKNFRDGCEVFSEPDALTCSEFVRDEANQYFSILLDSGDKRASCREQIAEAVFSTKGQVSDGIFARHRMKAYEKDPDLKPLSDSLRYAKFTLSNLYVKGPGEGDPQAYRAELDGVAEDKARLEAEVARRSADYRREQELWEVDAEKVASGLPNNSVLVEYMKFDRLTTGRETEPHYLLLVLDSQGEVFVSDLGSSEQIDSLVTLYRSHFHDVSERGGSSFSADLESYKDIASKLYERIWKPVEQKLSGGDLTFIAPDGALNLVSFAGLTAADGKYLIESHPIQYLSSGRDLVRLKHMVEPGTGLFALGDPDFDASPSARLSSEAALAQVPESDSLFFCRLRNVRSGCEALHEIRVLPLPGTRAEVERISEVWERESGEPCSAFFGPEASEDKFKRSAPGSRVIHLATHGYYAEGDCQPDLPKRRIGMSEGFVGENPLLLSGLFLAGANLHGEGADSLGVEDGILTAEEVTGMDLEGTKWVILSACESGLGEVKAGEGVYGLRRAFQMAGARTVISALWPVSDKATADMMSCLYGFEEDNLALAMQSLAKRKLEELRKRNQPDHPYLWAPFIAVGDWR